MPFSSSSAVQVDERVGRGGARLHHVEERLAAGERPRAVGLARGARAPRRPTSALRTRPPAAASQRSFYRNAAPRCAGQCVARAASRCRRERGEQRRRRRRRCCRRGARRAGCRPRSETTMPSLAERAHERGRVGRADADERAAPLGLARRGDDAAELVDAGDQPLVQRVHVLARRGDADLLHQLHAGDAGVDRRHRRRARLEAPRGRRRASSRGCPSRRCRGRRTSRSASASAARRGRAGTRGSRAPPSRAGT